MTVSVRRAPATAASTTPPARPTSTASSTVARQWRRSSAAARTQTAAITRSGGRSPGGCGPPSRRARPRPGWRPGPWPAPARARSAAGHDRLGDHGRAARSRSGPDPSARRQRRPAARSPGPARPGWSPARRRSSDTWPRLNPRAFSTARSRRRRRTEVTSSVAEHGRRQRGDQRGHEHRHRLHPPEVDQVGRSLGKISRRVSPTRPPTPARRRCPGPSEAGAGSSRGWPGPGRAGPGPSQVMAAPSPIRPPSSGRTPVPTTRRRRGGAVASSSCHPTATGADAPPVADPDAGGLERPAAEQDLVRPGRRPAVDHRRGDRRLGPTG